MTRAEPAATPPPPGGRSRWSRLAPLLGLTALVVGASLHPDPPMSSDLALEVAAVPLDPTDLSRLTVGPLRYRGGLRLRSPDLRFGGLSDLVVADDGRRLVAVSDCGRAFAARLSYDDRGALAGLDEARLVDLAGPAGRPLDRDEVDAEALAKADRDALLVGFEGRPGRVWRYGGTRPWRSALPVAIPGLDECGGNRGLESIAPLGDGRLLLICEGGGIRPESTPAFIGAGSEWTARSYSLDGGSAEPGDGYRPTSARSLPGGDVLVLERRYPPLGARLRLLSRMELAGAGPLAPREVATLEPPLTLDNLEGLEIRRAADGELLLYLLSDDNGCAKGPEVVPTRLQRTLLLMFAVDETALADTAAR